MLALTDTMATSCLLSGAAAWWPLTALLLAAAAVASAATSFWGVLACTVPLLGAGAGAGWRFSEWRQVTDVVRGGASTSDLKGAKDVAAAALFSGTLDPSQLGVAFAGMELPAESLPQLLSDLKGLVVNVLKGDGQEYSLSLRMRGSIGGATHKFRFRADEAAALEMPFRAFQPILRGKPAPQPAAPLKLDCVETFTLQIESGSGKQGGPFALTLQSILGIPGVEAPERGPPPRETRWSCRACQTMNYEAAKTCQRCGAARGVETVVVMEEAAAKAKKQKWSCPGCGAVNFPAAGECHKCGAART